MVQPDPQKGMPSVMADDAAFSTCGCTVRQDPGALTEELHMAIAMAEALYTKYENTHHLDPETLVCQKAIAMAAADAASPRYEIMVPSDPASAAAARDARARALAESAFSTFVRLVQLKPAFPISKPQPDPAAAAAARTQLEDTIRGLDQHIALVQCPDCECYLMEEEGFGWITTGHRSRILLALCTKRFKLKNNLNGVSIGLPAFTHDSRELGVAFPLRKVSSGITLYHTHIVDFDVHYQFCNRCSSKYENLSFSNDDNLEPLDYPPFPPLLGDSASLFT